MACTGLTDLIDSEKKKEKETRKRPVACTGLTEQADLELTNLEFFAN